MHWNIFITKPNSCKNIYFLENYDKSFEKALRNKKEEPEHNYKDDVFTLGMCLLHIALLKPCDDLFNYEEMVFLSNNMEKKYEEMGKYYSDRLTKFIKKMTVEQEEQRDDLIVLNDVFDQIIKMNEEVFYIILFFILAFYVIERRKNYF